MAVKIIKVITFVLYLFHSENKHYIHSVQFQFKGIYLFSHFQTHEVFIINERGEALINNYLNMPPLIMINDSTPSTDT